eukprot:2460124-Rhodomonas_salina.1
MNEGGGQFADEVPSRASRISTHYCAGVESLLLLTAVTATYTISGLGHPRSGAGYSCSAVYSLTLNMTITLCSGGADRTRSTHLVH